jgi:hypothetical protein
MTHFILIFTAVKCVVFLQTANAEASFFTTCYKELLMSCAVMD